MHCRFCNWNWVWLVVATAARDAIQHLLNGTGAGGPKHVRDRMRKPSHRTARHRKGTVRPTEQSCQRANSTQWVATRVARRDGRHAVLPSTSRTFSLFRQLVIRPNQDADKDTLAAFAGVQGTCVPCQGVICGGIRSGTIARVMFVFLPSFLLSFSNSPLSCFRNRALSDKGQH